MKRFFIILSLFFCGVVAFSQAKGVLSQVVDIECHQQPIVRVLKMLEKKSGVVFSYQNEIFSSKEMKTIVMHHKKLNDVLIALFQQDNLSFYAVKNQVVIYKLQTRIKKSQDQTSLKNKVDLKKKTLPPGAQSNPKLYTKKNKQKKDTVIRVFYDTIYQKQVVVKYDTVKKIVYDTIKKTKTDKAQKQKNTQIPISTPIPTDNVIHFSVEPVYQLGINKWNKTYSSTVTSGNNTVSISYKLNKNYRVGVIGYVTWSNFVVGTGLAYRQMEVNYNVGTTKKYTYTVSDSTWNRDTLKVLTSTKTGYKTANHDSINKYTYISIPVYVGVKQALSKKLSVSFGMTAWIDVLTSASGYSVDSAGEVSSISKNDIGKVKLELMSQCKFEYLIIPQLSAFVSPYYSIPIRVAKEENVFTVQDWNYFGINFGISYYFK
ncbi:MAG: hypothetical protein P4L28_09050 [Paludibacteraceae bacterium]|nr:hypothetical protein [Paludibacteraceae bacterium]